MVARFVAVGVLANQARNVGRGLAAFDDRTYREPVSYTHLPHNTRDEFRQLLKAENIDAIFRINPVGRIYGVTFICLLYTSRCV